VGKVKKGVKCSIEGCEEKAVRSLSTEMYLKAFPNAKLAKGGRIYLCRKHYKEFKREWRKIKKYEQPWRLT